MLSEPEGQEAIKTLAGIINSTDDFIDILEYFSLSDTELTELEAAFEGIEQNSMLLACALKSSASYDLFPDAHAIRRKIAKELGEKRGRCEHISLKCINASVDSSEHFAI